VVRWIFAQRLAGHSVARIARALNEAEVPCPSAADPGRNRHRPGTGWTLGTVTTILGNPRYTGHQVWNRQRTDKGADDRDAQRRRRTRRGANARHHASPEDVIAGLRANNVTLTFDAATGTLHAEGAPAIQIVTRKEAG
jgi:hypothetical protein